MTIPRTTIVWSLLALITVAPSVFAATEKVIHQFVPEAQGSRPFAGLVADAAGNLYGTTYNGGVYQCGVVYQMSRGRNFSWRQQVIHNFAGEIPGSPADGCSPFGGLAIDAHGNLYGTTEFGGAGSGGTVFELTPSGNGDWTEQVLHSFPFNGVGDGNYPLAGVTLDPNGNLFGTTYGGTGGTSAVFELSPSGNTWTETIVSYFPSGVDSETGIVEDAQGNLYGTTAPSSSQPGGSVWEFSPSSNGWTFQTLYLFGGNGTGDASDPVGIVLDSQGNIYGTTSEGGKQGYGAIFELQKSSAETWTRRILYDFVLNNAGVLPASPPTFDGKGNLYGTVQFVGTGHTGPDGGGAVYQLTYKSGWTESTLYTFQGGSDGFEPWGGVIVDAAGNLYGTTVYGGAAQQGTVFEMSLSNGDWIEKTLYAFPVTDGGGSRTGLIADAAGNLYGTAVTGGATANPCGQSGWGGCGTVFKLSPTSNGGWQETTIYNFTGNADGENPLGNLTFDASGNLYGTTGYGGYGAGSVFELSLTSNGTWNESTLFTFGAESFEGYEPSGSLALDSAGNVYGTTQSGGTNYGWAGTVFRLRPAIADSWTEDILYAFQGESDGASPQGGVVMDAAGNLYGTTLSGSNGGVVFELSPGSKGGWKETVLHTFSGVGDGAFPVAGLIFDSAGNLYGTTEGGGAYNMGTVFELSPNGDGTWSETILHSFTGPPGDGYQPQSSLSFDAAGNLYGTTLYGGDVSSNSCILGREFNCGAVYKLSPADNGAWNENLVYSFTGGQWDGSSPYGSVYVDAAGNIFGTTFGSGLSNMGVVYEITP